MKSAKTKDHAKMKAAEEKAIHSTGADSKSLDEVNGSVRVPKNLFKIFLRVISRKRE
ncbi:hypothetical protein [Lactiplantibacillus plantarum]|uniref:hypothetical protein n=1 Tax=Lactiplantibacillus plantarum TaxID=1590 RepID=UPI0015E026D9|nr:hypothetical protein [Lactiplantibacillus plantarum]QLL38169.1 hypothetical protein FEM49_01098 [Lactiplantibacillus plantarum]